MSMNGSLTRPGTPPQATRRSTKAKRYGYCDILIAAHAAKQQRKAERRAKIVALEQVKAGEARIERVKNDRKRAARQQAARKDQPS